MMTGRDLIVYILSNRLEDKPVFDNGTFIGFVTASEVAKKLNVGLATVHVWVHQKQLDGIIIGNTLYIPATFDSPIESNKL